MFNAIEYFENINNSMKLTKGKFKFCKVSGVANLEEVLANGRKHSYFFAVDDSEEGHTMKGGGHGYFERRAYTFFLLAKVNPRSMADRSEKLNVCRDVFRKIEAKMQYDEVNGLNGLDFLDNTRIRFNEFPGVFAFSTTGIMVQFAVDNPVTLIYDASDYE